VSTQPQVDRWWRCAACVVNDRLQGCADKVREGLYLQASYLKADGERIDTSSAMEPALEKKVIPLLKHATSVQASAYSHDYWMQFCRDVLLEACHRLQINGQVAEGSFKNQLVVIIETWIKVSRICTGGLMSHFAIGSNQCT
jgi:hypothetical protein